MLDKLKANFKKGMNMKTMALLAAVSLVLAGCEQQQESQMSEPAGAQKGQTPQGEELQKQTTEAQATAEKAATEAQSKLEATADKATATALAAQDKAASEADKQIAKMIRQSFTSETAPVNLSETAKDISIMVEDGMVTLKGTVKSEAEKTDLEERAKAIAGVQEIKSELEVKAE
jgi:osmotically-inducible protein OsmY